MTDMQNSTDGGDIEEAEKEPTDEYKRLAQMVWDFDCMSEEDAVEMLASTLSEARKRERERVREAVEKAFGGEPYLYHEVCAKVFDSLSETK